MAKHVRLFYYFPGQSLLNTFYSVTLFGCIHSLFSPLKAGPCSAIGRAPDSLVRGPGFETRSGHILLFLLPLIQEGQFPANKITLLQRWCNVIFWL